MITATHIDTAYAELRSAMRTHQEWAQLLAEAKYELETTKRQGLANGTIEGKNPEMREAAAQQMLSAHYAVVAELESAVEKAQLVLDLAKLEVERIRLHLRYQEVTLLAASSAIARQALSAEVAHA